MGESLVGKDKKILPLLYAIAFYNFTDQQMETAQLEEKDKETIKKVWAASFF